MDPALVTAKLQELSYEPLTAPEAGRMLYEFVLRTEPRDILELGFAHGTSTAYIAAALAEAGHGHVLTIDRAEALARAPNIEALLKHVGVTDWVTAVASDHSYVWELMRILEARTAADGPEPCFDFAFIDGAHSWEVDGFAFLLVDRLLRFDRWVLFDDVNWTYANSPSLRESEYVRGLPEDERSMPQIREVIDLLVRPSGYEVHLVGDYAFAYKPSEMENAHRDDLEKLLQVPHSALRELAFAHLRQRHVHPSDLPSSA